MKHSNEDLKRWKAEINAGLVIGNRITVSRENAEYVACCPFHEDKTPSFKVYRQDDHTWCYKCFGCGANGNVFQFIEKFDKIKFGEAVDKVLEIAGITGWESGKVQVDKTFGQALGAKKDFVTFPMSLYEKAEKAFDTSTAGQKWWADRGFTIEVAKQLHIGFVPDASQVSEGHPWVAQGWITFPTLSDDGQTVTAVKYRSIVAKKAMVGDKKVSGILRARDTSTTLYNIQDVTPMDDVFVVEGEPDVAALKQCGYTAVGYPSGEYTPNDSERDRLMRAKRRFLAGDMDSTGGKAMDKLWKELRDNTFRIEWPEGCKDANDVLQKVCGNDLDKMFELVEKLKGKALMRPVPDYYDMVESLENTDDTNPMDNPRRLHCKTPEVDAMAVTLPGNLVSVFATFTGSGKTTWILDEIELPEAMYHNSVVLNYSAELSVDELSILVAANLTNTNRLKIGKKELHDAAETLRAANARLYIGYNPDLNRIGLVLDSLEWAIRRLGANIVVLDHLHFLCRGEKDDIKAQADAMQRMKNMARKYDVIFIVVGQSRKPAQNTRGKSSDRWDAKGSETFTSDATTTYHIHRAQRVDIDWNAPDTWPDDLLENKTEIRLDKCRTKGPGKAVALQMFKGTVGKFLPYSTQMPELPPQQDFDESPQQEYQPVEDYDHAAPPNIGGFDIG